MGKQTRGNDICVATQMPVQYDVAATASADTVKLGARKSMQTFSGDKVFQEPFGSWTSAPKIMDVRTEKRIFPMAPVMGRNFLTPGHPGVRVKNVHTKFGPTSSCLCCAFLSEYWQAIVARTLVRCRICVVVRLRARLR